MMLRFPGLFSLALTLLACGCAAVGAPTQARGDASSLRGRAVAHRLCAACHAVEPGAESPQTTAPPFDSLEMRHTASLEGRLEELTRRGHYGMPPLKLRPDEVRDLVDYIASLPGGAGR